MGNVGIIGLGLIGGSMGLALMKSKLKDTTIIGYDREREVAMRAVRFGAVDRLAVSPETLADEAAFVIVAAPIVAVRQIFQEIAPRLHPGSVVTDTASTKGDVMKWALEYLPRHSHFVGGHPMAGKEKSGPQAAEASLFEGRPYCIIPTVDCSPIAVNAVRGLAESFGSIPFFLDADEHDSYAAAISHLPLVASVGLFSLARSSTAWPELGSMAGPGFQDLTRLASGSPEMSHDIFMTNKTNIGHWIDRYVLELLKLKDMIQGEDNETLFKMLAETQFERDNYLENPPQRELPGFDASDLPTPSQSLMALMAGGMWADRAREMTKNIEERSKEQERELRLRRRE